MVFGSFVYEAPLLPYEKQLIASIGLSEEEYRQFVGEVIRRNKIRPAGYEHIPDIRCEPATITAALVSLAIGVVTTAISYLLMPKPQAPGSDRSTRRQLDSITGGNRFTPSRGFDTTAELADYNAPVPIIFGLYNDVEKVGGLLVSPRLVWSRMFSYGRQQSAKLMFVVGEQGKADSVGPDGIIEPDLSGIFIGNNALDSIYSSNFAFYWKRNTTASGFSRIQNINRVFGSGGSKESADPNAGRFGGGDDVFLCPTRKGEFEKGFCHSYTPSNNTQFGVYSPIANGNIYRVNWRVISILRQDGSISKDDPKGTLRNERKKICGNEIMEGVGRNYSRRMGIVSHNGTECNPNDLFNTPQVQEGDTAVFLISDTKLGKDAYGETVAVDDINSEIESQQIAADDAMQIGELFAIGSTTWQVIDRSITQYRPGDGDQRITFRCIDTKEAYSPIIGIVNAAKVVFPEREVNDAVNNAVSAGAAFFPITRIARGLVRNSRACDVTEFGIKSVVFQRLNGICNFMSLPTSDELEVLDNDLVQTSAGTISSHISRTSIFTIYVRRAGLDESGNEFVYELIPRDFVVTGSKPIAQYNSIRIRHPQDKPLNEYEYKFVSRSGADMRSRSDTSEYVQLTAATSEITPTFNEEVEVGSYGKFKISTNGRIIDKGSIRSNKEFITKIDATNNSVAFGLPSSVGVNTFLPDDEPEGTTFLTAVDNQNERVLVSDPANAVSGRMGAFGFEAFGNPDTSGAAMGERKKFRTTEYVSDGRWVELEFLAERHELPADHFARTDSGQQSTWNIADYSSGLGVSVVSSSTGWDSLSRFTIKRGNGSTATRPPGTSNYSSNNPFAVNGLTMSGLEFLVVGVKRNVEVKGRSQGYFEEVFGKATSHEVGETKSELIDVTEGPDIFGIFIKKMRLKLTSRVISSSGHWSGRTKLWSQPTIEVVADSNVTTDRWEVGDTFSDLRTPSRSNDFASEYYQDNRKIGILYSIEAVSERIATAQSLLGDRIFENQSQYSDISLYGDLVQKSNESEPEHSLVYVNEIIENDPIPAYDKLTTAGLVLRASNTFNRLDQLRVWLGSGVQVRRLHPDLSTYNDSSNTTVEGPSNLFTDLVFYLLTNVTAGAGTRLNMTANQPNLINVSDLEEASRFLRANKLFCNGAISDKVNIREFISSNAPNFLCNFVLVNGKFSIRPALPTTAGGEISTNPVAVKQIFTSGNILEDTFELEFLGAEERRDFTALMRYRYERQNKFPEERTLSVRLASSSDDTSVETFDLTQFCTSREHAFMAAKYFLALRKLVTHSVKFGTTIDGLDLAPGDFIKVITEASPYSAASNGTISNTGIIVSATVIADGTYPITYYTTTSQDILYGDMQVSNGVATDSTFFNAIFTITESSTSENIYLVEQLTFEEDMTIRIVASEYPCDSAEASELAKLVSNDAAFTAEGPS